MTAPTPAPVTAPTLDELKVAESRAKAAAEAAGEAFRLARAAFNNALDQQNAQVSAGNVAKVEEIGNTLPGLNADRAQKEKLHETATNAYKRARRDRAQAELPVLREQSATYAIAVDVATTALAGEIRTYKTALHAYVQCLRDAEVTGSISNAPGFEKPRTSFGARVLGVIEGHL